MFDCKMVCLDIDGTLIDSRRNITPRVKEAIGRVDALGIPVVLVSGRGPGAMLYFLEELELTTPIISYGGALTLDRDGTPLYSRQISLSAAEELEALTRDRGIHLSAYRDREWFAREEDKWSREESHAIRMSPIYTNLAQLFRQWEKGPHKFLCMGEAQEIRWLEQAIAHAQLDGYRSMPTCLEVGAKGVSKAGAIGELGAILGIGRENVLAVGDNYNDVNMLLYAGMGVAMGNAPDEIKAQADDITATNDEDGVAVALERYVLSRI